jgi:hypothetical protein
MKKVNTMNLYSQKVKTALVLSTAIAIGGLTANSAQAAIVFTFEAPGVQFSQASNITTESFDLSPTGVIANYVSPIGTYDKADIRPADQYGGADNSSYLVVFSPNSTTLTLNSPQAYFGMWWSAGDGANQLNFYSGANLIGSYTTESLLSSLPAAYYGNPNAPTGRNTHEPYAYINFFGTNGTTFDRIMIGGSNFESDNHSISALEQRPTGTAVSTPEPASLLGLLVVGGLGAGSIWKRKMEKGNRE